MELEVEKVNYYNDNDPMRPLMPGLSGQDIGSQKFKWFEVIAWARYSITGSVFGGFGKTGTGQIPDKNTRQWIGTIASGYGTVRRKWMDCGPREAEQVNYYNDNDPKAAAWLRALIKQNLIPAGDVDERSIEDVTKSDLRGD